MDQKTLEKMLFLARLDVAETEQQTMLHQLEHTLELIDRMHEAPTSGVPPLEHPLAQQLEMRGDVVEPVLPTESVELPEPGELTAMAPAMHDGSFLVPQVIDGE